uniref:Uncharacterized protein n=1 Tax=Globodera rostochiensis TaxID=31243 RepID=A0A914GXX0_GLORO
MDPKSVLFNELVDFLHKRRFSEADELLLANPKLLKYTDSARRMAVHYAAGGGHLDFVRRELESKPQLANLEDDTGWTLLLLASSSGHLEIVRLLMNFQIDVNHRISTGQSALHFACSKDHLGVARELIDNGADLNAQDERGTTPLHKAASQGHQRIVNLLMGNREKLQIDLPNREGDTPLHLACEDQQMDVALFLVRSGANLEKKNRQNQTPTDLVHKMQKTPKTSKITKREKFEEFRLAERQFHEFGFTCYGFINMYRSILIENWTFVLDEFALKQINQKMHFSESTDTKQFDSLRDRLASRILYNGRLDLILDQAKSHLNDFFLNVVDVKDEDEAPSYDDEAEIMREIEQLEGEILTLRALQ